MILKNICLLLLLIGGFICLGLALWLPHEFEMIRIGHGGVVFIPGFQSLQDALTTLFTAFSILTTISFVFVAVPFVSKEAERRKPLSLLLSILTLISFVSGIIYSLFYSLIRPLTGTAPTIDNLYFDLQILLVSLSLALFTVASMIPRVESTNE
jgi:hypothetical protein